MAIELHCHTIFSVDAYGTPEDAVDTAAERGVTVMAMTEHNHMGSFARAKARADMRGIRYLAGIEFDAEWKGKTYHFLGLGFDANDPAVNAIAARHTALYSQRFERLFKEFESFGYSVSRDKLLAALPKRYPTHPSPILNQWFAGDYLVETGVLPDKRAYEELLLRIRDNILEEEGEEALGKFCPFAEIRDAIQNAGGVVLLAHVARYAPGDFSKQVELIHELLDAGMDGFELYHFANLREPHFTDLAREAERGKIIISGGSDSHNSPLSHRPPLGSCKAPEEILERLNNMLARRQLSAAK